jgi:uncharacterized protein YkwD
MESTLMILCAQYESVMSVEEQTKLLAPINAARFGQGLPALEIRLDLSCVAQTAANEAFIEKYCDHRRLSDRIFECQSKIKGEVIACNFLDHWDATIGLLESPPHYKIIMIPSLKYAGVGKAGFDGYWRGWYTFDFD